MEATRYNKQRHRQRVSAATQTIRDPGSSSHIHIKTQSTIHIRFYNYHHCSVTFAICNLYLPSHPIPFSYVLCNADPMTVQVCHIYGLLPHTFCGRTRLKGREGDGTLSSSRGLTYFNKYAPKPHPLPVVHGPDHSSPHPPVARLPTSSLLDAPSDTTQRLLPATHRLHQATSTEASLRGLQ